jgi:hypothetical protein
VDKASRCLNGVHDFVARNIKWRLALIFEALEIVADVGKVIGRICSLREYLQDDRET